MTYSQLQAVYHAEIRRLAEMAWRSYMQQPCQYLYLMGRREPRPGGSVWAEFTIGQDDSPAWECVTPEHIRRDMTVDQLCASIQNVLRREPLAMFADS